MPAAEDCMLGGAARVSACGPCPRCGFDENPGSEVEPDVLISEDAPIGSKPSPYAAVSTGVADLREKIEALESVDAEQVSSLAIDLVPVVHSLLLEHWLRRDRVSLVDVGSASRHLEPLRRRLLPLRRAGSHPGSREHDHRGYVR